MSGGTNVLGGQLSWGDTCPGGQMSGGHLSRGTNVGGTVVGGTNVTPPHTQVIKQLRIGGSNTSFNSISLGNRAW